MREKLGTTSPDALLADPPGVVALLRQGPAVAHDDHRQRICTASLRLPGPGLPMKKSASAISAARSGVKPSTTPRRARAAAPRKRLGQRRVVAARQDQRRVGQAPGDVEHGLRALAAEQHEPGRAVGGRGPGGARSRRAVTRRRSRRSRARRIMPEVAWMRAGAQAGAARLLHRARRAADRRAAPGPARSRSAADGRPGRSSRSTKGTPGRPAPATWHRARLKLGISETTRSGRAALPVPLRAAAPAAACAQRIMPCSSLSSCARPSVQPRARRGVVVVLGLDADQRRKLPRDRAPRAG